MSDIQDAVTLATDLKRTEAKRDSQLEQAITDACTRLSMATTQDQAYIEFECIRVLIAQRSQEQVARLSEIKRQAAQV